MEKYEVYRSENGYRVARGNGASLRRKEGNMLLIEEKNGYQIYQDINSNPEYFYVVRDNKGSGVKSAIPGDMPESGVWFSNGYSDKSIKYVANPRKWRTAKKWFKQLCEEVE